MPKVLSQSFVVLLVTLSWFHTALGQPVLPSDLKKPEKYENRKLGAEKSAEKKFRGPRRFVQNTVTHYNWYFNANNKINQVLERAKLVYREDYSQLLPFYNYSLETTAADKNELDSVIYKANTGILIHDLRNVWIDNLYMLMGKAYYFRNDLDSAYLTFQHINYAFSPKEADGYDIPIGSNATEGSNALSVSTKENPSIVKKAFSTPPSRNESFIWQIKTFIGLDRMPQAASLIQTLRNDPVFPERLQTDLKEVQALWFYKEKNYDSAAVYLEQALGNATSRQELSRWEFLIAQLYELAEKPDLAAGFYDQARQRTLDPVLEVYAILNGIRQHITDSASIRTSLEELKKMGRRDRYTKYRDIIYYTAAQIELDRNNIAGAKAMLLKATEASAETLNPAQRTRSFLLLADISFKEKNYPDAKRFYDSVNNNDPGVTDAAALNKRKDVLQHIVQQMDVIARQDSLQQLAAMPEAEREALLKKKVRQLRKLNGLKDEEEPQGNAAMGLNNSGKAPDLFQGDTKGEWYFNNPSLKSKGYSAFRQTWGDRPNVDNWRRQASVSKANIAAKQNKQGQDAGGNTGDETAGGTTYEALLKNIPLTSAQLEKSKDSIADALLELGIIYINDLEEYPAAIDTLENFVQNHPYHNRVPEGLYYLYYAYQKTGNGPAASQAYNELQQKYKGTKYQQQIENAVTGKNEKEKAAITSDYEKIYNLFIEGNFEEALAQKKISDSLYGSSYWTPQLLYIETVYHLHNRDDAEAKKILDKIIAVFPEDPMAQKAKTILEVLGRRKEIEDYLTKLEIKRVEDTVFIANAPARPREQIGTPMVQDSTTIQPIKPRFLDTTRMDKPVVTAPDSIAVKQGEKAPVATTFSFDVGAPHAVVIVLNKVDPVYVTESRNAFNRYNQEKYYNQPIVITNQTLNDTLKLVVMSGFGNAPVAIGYMEKTQAVAPTQIIPWLPAGKYSFVVISEHNLEVLKNNKDLQGYLKFQERYFPEK